MSKPKLFLPEEEYLLSEGKWVRKEERKNL